MDQLPAESEPQLNESDLQRRALCAGLAALLSRTGSLAPCAAAAASGASLFAAQAATVPPAPSLVTVGDGRRVSAELASIINNGILRVASVGFDVRPFLFKEGDKMAGIEAAILEDIAKYLGVKLSYDTSSKSFSEVVNKVSEGEADIGAGKLGRTPARVMKVAFTEPIAALKHAILFNRKELLKFKSGKTMNVPLRKFVGSIAVLKGSSFEESAQIYFPLANILSFANWDDAVNATSKGKVAVAYRDELEIRTSLAKDPTVVLSAKAFVFKDLQSYICMAIPYHEEELERLASNLITVRAPSLNNDALFSHLAIK